MASAARVATIATTTISSTREKPRRETEEGRMGAPPLCNAEAPIDRIQTPVAAGESASARRAIPPFSLATLSHRNRCNVGTVRPRGTTSPQLALDGLDQILGLGDPGVGEGEAPVAAEHEAGRQLE